MVLIPDNHLIARFEGQAVYDHVVPFTRIPDDGNFLRIRSQILGQNPAGSLAQIGELFTVMGGGIGVKITSELEHLLLHRIRRRTEVGRVEHDQTLPDRKIFLDELPEFFPPCIICRKPDRGLF